MIPTYGLLVSAGIAASTILAWRFAPRLAVSRDALIDVIFWAIIGGVVGARLLFIIVQWEYFADLCSNPDAVLPVGVSCAEGKACLPGQECVDSWCRNVGDCLAPLKFWQGGWVFLGGILGGTITTALAAWWTRVGFLKAMALLAVGAPLGHIFGRVGCYFQGCCFGKHADHALAIDGVLPVQLWEAGGDALIFVVMVLFFLGLTRSGRPLGRWELGSVPVLYLSLYAPLRFVTEWFRGDAARGFLWTHPWPGLAEMFGFSPREPVFFSTSQAISTLLLVGCLLFWVAFLRYHRRSRP